MKAIRLSEIVVDWDIQCRLNQLDDDSVKTYTVIYQSGGKLPPIDVFLIDGQYLVADGFHRVAAAIKAGLKTIPAIVREGDLSDAKTWAEEANMKTGLKYSNLDKKNILKRRMKDGRNGWRWDGNILIQPKTYSAFERVYGVTRQTISTWVTSIVHEIEAERGEKVFLDQTQTLNDEGEVVNIQKKTGPVKSKRRKKSNGIPATEVTDDVLVIDLPNPPLPTDGETVQLDLFTWQQHRDLVDALRHAFTNAYGKGVDPSQGMWLHSRDVATLQELLSKLQTG